MGIDIERLKVDPAYWDEVGAPRDATHFETGEGEPECWAKIVGERFYHWSPIQEWHVWNPKNTEPFIPRPTKPEPQEWDGEGEIPIPCRCEVRHPTDTDKWFECDVVARRFGYIWWRPDTNDIGREVHTSMFRPRRTKEQREREELTNLIRNTPTDITFGQFDHAPGTLADAIIAPGWKKGE